MRWYGCFYCLLSLLLAGNVYSGGGRLWLSSNIAIVGTGEHYNSTFKFIEQKPSMATDSISADNQRASYTLDPGFAVGVSYEGAIDVHPGLNLTHEPKLSFTQAVIHFPNGVGIFSSPITIESQSLIVSEQLYWNIIPKNFLAEFAIGVGYRHIFNHDTFRLGSWGFSERPSWGEVFYEVQAYIPLNQLISSDNIAGLILSVERSRGHTLPQVRVEVGF